MRLASMGPEIPSGHPVATRNIARFSGPGQSRGCDPGSDPGPAPERERARPPESLVAARAERETESRVAIAAADAAQQPMGNGPRDLTFGAARASAGVWSSARRVPVPLSRDVSQGRKVMPVVPYYLGRPARAWTAATAATSATSATSGPARERAE